MSSDVLERRRKMGRDSQRAQLLVNHMFRWHLERLTKAMECESESETIRRAVRFLEWIEGQKKKGNLLRLFPDRVLDPCLPLPLVGIEAGGLSEAFAQETSRLQITMVFNMQARLDRLESHYHIKNRTEIIRRAISAMVQLLDAVESKSALTLECKEGVLLSLAPYAFSTSLAEETKRIWESTLGRPVYQELVSCPEKFVLHRF